MTEKPHAKLEPALTPDNLAKLVQMASAAQKNAYAPYSKKPEGAALLCADGSVYLGSSVEFATFGGSVSADLACLVKARNDGHSRFLALAIMPFNFPAGSVRQFYAEFDIDTNLIVESPDGLALKSFRELLPKHFGPDNLEQAKNKA